MKELGHAQTEAKPIYCDILTYSELHIVCFTEAPFTDPVFLSDTKSIFCDVLHIILSY